MTELTSISGRSPSDLSLSDAELSVSEAWNVESDWLEVGPQSRGTEVVTCFSVIGVVCLPGRLGLGVEGEDCRRLFGARAGDISRTSS